jgi:hypothetical protein
MTEAGTGAPAAPTMGVFQKLVGVFFSPSKTFEAIAAKPGWDWLVPVVLMMVAIFGVQRATVPKIDIDEATAVQMKFVERMNRNLTDADREKIEAGTREGFEKQKDPVRSLIAPIFVWLPLLVVSGIYMGIAAASGKSAGFKRILAGYAWVQCIQVLVMVLTILVALPQTSLSANDVQYGRVLKSNVAAFLDFDTTSKPLLALLSSIDVFDFLYVAINGIALSKTTKFTLKQAYGVVGTVWGLYIVLKVILGAVYAYLMG